MKKLILKSLTVCLLVLSLAQAQEIKLAFVNPNALLAAHPAGKAAAGLIKQRDDELAPLLSELQTLQQKAETAEGLTPDERGRATLLVRTVEEVRKRYTTDIQAASAPAIEAINAAVAAVAQANGYTLVLDGDLAGTTGLGLVVYVDPNQAADITEQVIAQMNGQ
jgi:outer membrane protein